MIKINEKTKTAEVFYARHITHGISNYSTGNTLITKEALDRMNDTFEGKPVVITHKDWQNQDPVGYVVKSFYLPQDGYFWVEFIINDDVALSYIKNQNFRVSCGYRATESAAGGVFHDIEYTDEVLNGEYLHLALTNTPRFAEAIIMNRNDFKDFVKSLEKIDNKFNEEDKMEFFRKQKVEKSEEILNTSFKLNEKEFTVKEMIDLLTEKMNEAEAKITVCDGEFTKEELVDRYNACMGKLNEKEEAEKKAKEEEEKKNEEEKAKKEAEEKAKAEEEAKKKAEEEKKNEAEKLNERMNKVNEAKNEFVQRVYQMQNGKLVRVE